MDGKWKRHHVLETKSFTQSAQSGEFQVRTSCLWNWLIDWPASRYRSRIVLSSFAKSSHYPRRYSRGMLLHYNYYWRFACWRTSLHKANILVSNNLRCCLADFGLALSTANSQSWSTAISSTTKGAIRWMAPELFHHDGSVDAVVDHPSRDIYAFGCTVIEVCSLSIPSTFPKLNRKNLVDPHIGIPFSWS